jgi:hypothetical protein
VGVAYLMPELRTFAAQITNSSHFHTIVSNGVG